MKYQDLVNAAQGECLKLLDAGWDWADAQCKASEMFSVDPDELQAWYDADEVLEASCESRRNWLES